MSSEKFKVLVIEDNSGDIRLLEEAFLEYSLQIDLEVLHDGKAVVSHLDKSMDFLPSLILLDINLPGYDGRDILKKIKTRSEFQKIPVIVWTSSEDPLLINECKDSKADAVIVKPTDFEGYVAMIQRVLSDYLR